MGIKRRKDGAADRRSGGRTAGDLDERGFAANERIGSLIAQQTANWWFASSPPDVLQMRQSFTEKVETMAKLRHLALFTRQPEKLADFYRKVFELEEVFRTKNGSVHLSDGEVNLAILNANDPKDPDDVKRMGMYHFGFHVDDQETVARRIQELYPEGAPKSRPKGTSYAETRGMDPDGNLFDISTWGWSGKTLPKERGGLDNQ
jgi:catechol 2,3-dioxygenase-like lactoylglutathione lyase family enzyme